MPALRKEGGGAVSAKLTAEQVRDAVYRNSTYNDIYEVYQVSLNYMQAIADELNAALGGGECEMVRVSKTRDTRKCSACGKLTHFDPLDRYELNYCPKCGARVRKAVKR